MTNLSIEVREYLQSQSVTYITPEQAEALTVGLMEIIPPDRSVPTVIIDRPASETYPAVTRYARMMRTRINGSRYTGAGYLARSTENKHIRVRETLAMLDEIDELRATR